MSFSVLTNNDWIKFWEMPNPGFHKNHVSPTLKKHMALLTGGRSNLRVFVPMCGKSLDMKWLADQGHRVVGVEVVPKAVEQFFTEQKIPYTTTPAPGVGGTLYESKDKKIQVYLCDIYNVTPQTVGGQFDAIWDRAAMDAANRKDRAKYGEVLLSLMAPGCRCVMAALQYDETKHPGPPHNVSDQAVLEAFKKGAVKEIGNEDATADILPDWKFDKMWERIFLITPK